MWPPVRVGHVYEIRTLGVDYHLVTLCTRPAVFAIPDFLTQNECSHLVKSARNRLEAALVSGPNGKEVDAFLRNNKQAMLSTKHSPITMEITSRVCAFLRVPVPVKVLKSDGESANTVTKHTNPAVGGDAQIGLDKPFVPRGDGSMPNRNDSGTNLHAHQSINFNNAAVSAQNVQSCGGYLTVLQYKERQHFLYHYDSGGPHRRMATMLYYLNEVCTMPLPCVFFCFGTIGGVCGRRRTRLAVPVTFCFGLTLCGSWCASKRMTAIVICSPPPTTPRKIKRQLLASSSVECF